MAGLYPVVEDYMRSVVGRYSVSAGLLLRGQVRRFLEQQRFRQRPGFLEYREVKGLLSSNFLVTLRGPQALVAGWIGATDDLFCGWTEEPW